MPKNHASGRAAHPWPIRVMHWVGVYAIGCMILSGWQIYDASPSLPFEFPPWMTLGGWLAGGIAWHIAAMWLLFADGLAYLCYGVASGHFRRQLSAPRPGEVIADLGRAARFRLPHRLGHYNAVQRLLYDGVIVAILLAIATGLSIWKPVQIGWLTGLFGGYPVARGIHLAMMGLIVGFVVVHVVLVAIYPRTLVSMVAGLAAEPAAAGPLVAGVAASGVAAGGVTAGGVTADGVAADGVAADGVTERETAP